MASAVENGSPHKTIFAASGSSPLRLSNGASTGSVQNLFVAVAAGAADESSSRKVSGAASAGSPQKTTVAADESIPQRSANWRDEELLCYKEDGTVASDGEAGETLTPPVPGIAEAAVAAEKLRSMTDERFQAIWIKLREEFDVQTLIWNDICLQRKEKSEAFAQLREILERALAEDVANLRGAGLAAGYLQDALAKNAELGEILNDSTKSTALDVLEACRLFQNRRELVTRLECKAIAANEESGSTSDCTASNDISDDSLVEACALEDQDLGLLYRVRRALNLPMGTLQSRAVSSTLSDSPTEKPDKPSLTDRGLESRPLEQTSSRFTGARGAIHCISRTSPTDDSLWSEAASWQLDPFCPDRGVPAYLARFGFEASNLLKWYRSPKDCPARLSLNLESHIEKAGATWYLLQCSLTGRLSRETTWPAPRRLCQLRTSLHDRVVRVLAENYHALFKNAHFAGRGAFAGTTSKLRAWLSTLAGHINEGNIPPELTAITLFFLQAPVFNSGGAEMPQPDFYSSP